MHCGEDCEKVTRRPRAVVCCCRGAILVLPASSPPSAAAAASSGSLAATPPQHPLRRTAARSRLAPVRRRSGEDSGERARVRATLVASRARYQFRTCTRASVRCARSRRGHCGPWSRWGSLRARGPDGQPDHRALMCACGPCWPTIGV